MADQLERILSQLLVPDNEIIQQATQELRQAVKDPSIVPVLCQVIAASTNPQVRQYAAVVLRRRIMKGRQWRALPTEVCDNIRSNILQVLLQESEKSVRKSVSQVIATVAKHDLPNGKWPGLFQFLQDYTASQDSNQREIGMYVLSTVASVAIEQLRPHFPSLLELCAKTLQDQQNPMVPFYTVETLTYMVPMTGSDEAKAFQVLIPRILEVIQALIPVDEEKATEAMEVFDELVECEVAIIVPHIKSIIDFSLQVGANTELSSSLRIKALSFVSWLTQLKRKSILKLKLTQPILQILFPILCEEEEDEDDFEEAEAHTAPSFAAQVVDTMAQNLPPEKFVPPLMRLVEPALASGEVNQRRAAYVALAVSAEGCADHIRNKLLNSLLQCVYKGLSDDSPAVRGAALFALGQFSEHLQPDISKFSNELLPILFESLNLAKEHMEKEPRVVTKTYYALEMFCENLGKDILPYLPQLMDYLLSALSTATTPHAKELAISAIGATANAAREEIVPFFAQIMELLKGFLVPTQDEGQLKVQVQALDTLGVLARTMGPHFQPLAKECVQLGLTLMGEADDPDLRRCIYGLFAAVSTLLKEEMAQFLEPMVKQMIVSLKSTEGIMAHYAEEESQMFKIFGDDQEEDIENEEDDEDDEDSEGPQGFSVENSYLEEKEDSCCALGELAANTGVAFMPFMEESYKEVSDLLEYPAANIRKGAITAVGHFCWAVSDAAQETKSAEAITALHTMLQTSVPTLIKTVQEDTDRQVVIVTLETFKEMLDRIKTPMLEGVNRVDQIMTMIRNVLQQKTACQDQAEEDSDAGDEQAEYDNMLIENAGDLIPSVAKVVGGLAFAPYFAGLLPELLKRLKKNSATSEKSFAVGTLADTLEACGCATSSFVQHLYPVFITTVLDEDEEVRSNSVYALGVLAANSGESMYIHYPALQKLLFDLLKKEQDRRVIDNICAATCRLIWTNIDGVLMTQMFPALLQCLPLEEDFEENATIFPCLAQLYKNSHAVVLEHLPQLVSVMAQVIGTDQVTPEIQTLLSEMIVDISQKYPEVLQKTLAAMSQDFSTKLQTYLTTPQPTSQT